MKGKKTGGRKPKYDEPTTTVAFRIPVSAEYDVKLVVASVVAGYLKPSLKKAKKKK